MGPSITATTTKRPPLLLLLLPLLLLLLHPHHNAAAAEDASSAPAPIQLGGWADRRACKRVLQAVERQRRRAAKQAEREGRPVVTLSYAQTLDGCIAWAGRKAADISCPAALAMTHSLRASHDCILVGAGTLQQDNPRLNVRLPGRRRWWRLWRRKRPRDPRPVLLVSALAAAASAPREGSDDDDWPSFSWLWKGRPPPPESPPPLPFDPARLRLARPPIVFTPDLPQLIQRLGGPAAAAALRARGWEFVECKAAADAKADGGAGGAGGAGGLNGRRCEVKDCLRMLRALFGCRAVMVEGGARVLTACLRAGVVDVACVTVALAMMAPRAGYRAVQGRPGEGEGWLVRFGERDWEALRVGRDVVFVGAPDRV